MALFRTSIFSVNSLPPIYLGILILPVKKPDHDNGIGAGDGTVISTGMMTGPVSSGYESAKYTLFGRGVDISVELSEP